MVANCYLHPFNFFKLLVLWIWIRMDLHHFGILDPHLHEIKIRIRFRIKVISWILNRINLQIESQNVWNMSVPRRLFFAAQQRIAITRSPKYYQKMHCFITRKNQKEYGPDVK